MPCAESGGAASRKSLPPGQGDIGLKTRNIVRKNNGPTIVSILETSGEKYKKMTTGPKTGTQRRPGRPKVGTDLRDAILDAAELIFADAGYVGTKMRDIADKAGINQSLIRYYFGSKEELFDEVFRRRGAILSGRRHVLLDEVLAASQKPQVRDILRAYLAPQWEMKYSGPSGAAFVRLQARLHAEPEEHSLRLRREVYDASVKRYISELCLVLPQFSREVVSLRMAFVVGTYMFMLNDLGRLNDLTDGQLGDVDKDSMLRHLSVFLSAGLTAPLP